MKGYNLPKGYLSFSSYTLWKQNKDRYYNKYFLKQDDFKTAETIFGKNIAERLENNENINDKIIMDGIAEFGVDVITDKGLRLIGKIDRFIPETFSIIEYKTGHRNKQGKPSWDKVKVRRHKQLPFYSLLINLMYGKVDPIVKLQWIETRFKVKEVEFDGHVLQSDKTTELELTGYVETFEREIEQWERDNLLKDIHKVAEEISKDYTLFKNGRLKYSNGEICTASAIKKGDRRNITQSERKDTGRNESGKDTKSKDK